jgi:general secretion pathway protein E
MQETGLPLLLVRLGLCSEKDVATALATVTGLPVLTADDYPDTPVCFPVHAGKSDLPSG